MTQDAERVVTADGPGDTGALGERIGQALRRPAVIALTGGLGTGKTVFVQGLARGLDVPDEFPVTSPTYALIHEYPGRIPLVHADLYRLSGPADAEEIGLFELFDAGAVLAVEWADRLGERLPDHLAVRLETLASGARRIRLQAYGRDFELLIQTLEL